eukprot:GHVS01090723.1.p1 GENE.GHVS01090723.1~~GHVS01090723.1.p1  ORF type:complete len:356 (+),score=95.41 GHVS01090723.1:86-1153(+)
MKKRRITECGGEEAIRLRRSPRFCAAATALVAGRFSIDLQTFNHILRLHSKRNAKKARMGKRKSYRSVISVSQAPFSSPGDRFSDALGADEDTADDVATRLGAIYEKALLILADKGNDDETLADRYGVEITGKIMRCLASGVWLQDEIINYYMKLLQDHNDKNSLCRALSPASNLSPISVDSSPSPISIATPATTRVCDSSSGINGSSSGINGSSSCINGSSSSSTRDGGNASSSGGNASSSSSSSGSSNDASRDARSSGNASSSDSSLAVSHVPRCYFLSTFFYHMLSGEDADGYNFTRVSRWTTRHGVDLFALEKVVLPVHVGKQHWALGAIDLRRKEIALYDSMKGTADPAV